jgi:hypothetical protein
VAVIASVNVGTAVEVDCFGGLVVSVGWVGSTAAGVCVHVVRIAKRRITHFIFFIRDIIN